MPDATKHILVIRLSAMGDVAMTVPVINALIQQNPQLKITLLTKSFFKPFFNDIKNVSVVVADVKGKHKGVFGIYKLAQELNSEYRFYAIADLHNVLRSQVLKTFLKSKRIITINKGRKEKKELIKGNFFKPLKSTHQRYAEVFERLGFTVDLSNPKFLEKRSLSKKTLGLLGNIKPKSIGIAPFAAFEGKMYPLEQMKLVINQLSKTNNIILASKC
mgnify:CR=1 FL=1